MDFYLMPIMGFQLRGVAVESNVLPPTLRKDPVAAGLLQAAAQHRILPTGRAGCGHVAVVGVLVGAGCTGLGAGIGLRARLLLVSGCTARASTGAARASATAATGLCESHACRQHESH